jgi:hypothetical protein
MFGYMYTLKDNFTENSKNSIIKKNIVGKEWAQA